MAAENLLPNFKPEVYNYFNYRIYLRHMFDFMRVQNRKFTTRKLCRDINLSSGHLSDVLSGRRDLSQSTFNKLATQFKLSETDQSFLWHLVLFNDAVDLESRGAAFRKISRFNKFKIRHGAELNRHQLLTAWYYTAIMQLTKLPNFQLDPHWIKAKLRSKVTINQIKDAISFLLENKFIQVDSNGKISGHEKLLRSDSELLRLGMANAHHDFMELAGEAIYTIPRDERHLLLYTLAISQSDFIKIRNLLESTLAEVRNIAANSGVKGPSDSVYSVALYALPLTESKEGMG
jgi:uncharacterized protein (TIGR02147 family)